MAKMTTRTKKDLTKTTTGTKKEPPSDITDEEGYLCLKGPIFWKWRALDSELRATSLELESAKTKIQAEIHKNATLVELLGQQSALISKISVDKGELLNVQAEIEKLLGVSLQDCAFDDKTGRLYNLNTNGARGEPVKPVKRRVRKATS